MKKFVNIIITIICTLTTVILVFVLLSVICPELSNCFVALSKKISNSNVLGCFLSGLLGALITGGITYLSLNNTTKELQMDNQIKFRNLFSEEKRWRIQLILLYIADLKNETQIESKIKKKELNSALTDDFLGKFAKQDVLTVEDFENILKKHIFDLYDYMGIYEIAQKMIEDRILNKKMFDVSYRYKLNALNKSDTVKQELDNYPEDWIVLRKLLNINV